MPAVTPSFVADFETNVQTLVEDEYARFQDPANRWWDLVTRVRPSATKREILSWILSTASLHDQGGGGNFRFQDPVMLETEFTNKTAGAGLRIRREQFEDIDGNGIDGGEGIELGTSWARDMGAQFGYWPQLKVAELVKNGEVGTTYDGRPFFHAAHYNNGRDDRNGTFANLLAHASEYRIDRGVTHDVAAENLAKVYKAIRSIKMPNGKQVRMLRPAGLLCGPALFPRASQLVDAKFLAISAASGGGSGDFDGYTARMGYGRVTEAPELVESEYDTSYFVVVEQIGSSQLGGLVYVDRESFSVRYYMGRGGAAGMDAILDRLDLLEWHASGRNKAGYGHPYLLIKVKTT